MSKKPESNAVLKQRIAESKEHIQDMYRAVTRLRHAVESGDMASIDMLSLATERLQNLLERNMDDMDASLTAVIDEHTDAVNLVHQSATRLRELQRQAKHDRQTSYEFGHRTGVAEAKKELGEALANLQAEHAATKAELEGWQQWWSMLDEDLQEEIKDISAQIAADRDSQANAGTVKEAV